ncbi:hypothetical protein X801_01451 [Opisthorchis viverrini]|uniref:Uncharacterized protein n=1 Tax=Opisthorchis viverrini TaxID=6198 RepID=A0A1S8X7I0_OPIVI|nr:hypothetical protein X801_01451 [Opisthorchis viverrini]
MDLALRTNEQLYSSGGVFCQHTQKHLVCYATFLSGFGYSLFFLLQLSEWLYINSGIGGNHTLNGTRQPTDIWFTTTISKASSAKEEPVRLEGMFFCVQRRGRFIAWKHD